MARFLPGPLGSRAKAQRTAQDFADLVGRVVNATISQAPLTFVDYAGAELTGYIAHVANKLPVPLPLANGHYLYLFQLLGLRRKERYLTTLEYRYQYQATSDSTSWIFRYEYIREPPPPYPYPLCHLHINAQPASYTGAKPFDELHLPAGERVTVEAIARHLIVEHGVSPISPNWEAVLEEAEASFREIQRRRVRL